MDLLQKIIIQKKEELARFDKTEVLKKIVDSVEYNRIRISAKKQFEQDDVGIIAEFKRKSPSKPNINPEAAIRNIVPDYALHGARVISVLTDQLFFGGSLVDLQMARAMVDIPLLRKDFIIDSFQLHEARAFGADMVLIIAAALERNQSADLIAEAKNLGLEVLLEIHSQKELGHICKEVDFVGVNNRNLKTFSVDINRSIQLAGDIPNSFIKVSESGINFPHEVRNLAKAGYKAVLMGEKFMRHQNPGIELKSFISELNSKNKNYVH